MTLTLIRSHLTAISPHLVSIGKGLELGCRLNEDIQSEQSFRQGRHHFFTGMIQFSLVNTAFEAIEEFFSRTKLSVPLFPIKCVCLLMPGVIALAASQSIKNIKLRKFVNFIQDAVGPLCFIVSTISAIGLFILGERVYAVSALTYFGISLLTQIPRIPRVIRRIIEQTGFIVGNTCGVAFGGVLTKVICAVDLIGVLSSKIFKQVESFSARSNRKRITPSASIPSPLTTDQIKTLDDKVLEINKEHLKQLVLPSPIEKINLAPLCQLALEFDWSSHQDTIVKKVSQDSRFVELSTEKNPIEYLKENINTLTNKVQFKQILDGEPYNYDILQRYLQYICQELPKQEKSLQADILIQLGVEGGDYCGAGVFHAVEECYAQLLYQSKDLSLEKRILMRLQQKREEVWHRFYYLIWKINPFTQLLGYLSDITAVHTYHRHINFCNATKEFGILSEAAAQDPEAYVSPSSYAVGGVLRFYIKKLFWKQTASLILCYIQKNTQPNFKNWQIWKRHKLTVDFINIEGYSVDSILDTLKETIGSPLLPKADVYKWWQSWIEKQSTLSTEQKQVEIDQLNSLGPELFGESFSPNGHDIKSKFLKAMLIDMGVFKLKNA